MAVHAPRVATVRRLTRDRAAMTISFRIAFFSLIITAAGWIAHADQPPVEVLFPKERSVVGERVNVVLDPAADFSGISSIQVSVGGGTPVVIDPSTGRHAAQGIELNKGENRITIKFFGSVDEKKKNAPIISTKEITVFSTGLFPWEAVPHEFSRTPFHSKEQEAVCSGCHRMDTEPQDRAHSKPEDVLCYTCHKDIPSGAYIHGPAAVWNCLACHNPDLEPFKYQFVFHEPWSVTKTFEPVQPELFSFPSSALFKQGTAYLDLSNDKALVLFGPILESLKRNPGYRIRIEAHYHGRLPKSKGGQTVQKLTSEQAAAVARALNKLKISPKKITAVGMGNGLPKVPNATNDAAKINSRIEIIVYPPYIKIKNSLNLPVLKDRERVVVTLAYTRGPAIGSLQVIENLPPGMEYIKGTGLINGVVKEPLVQDGKLVWNLGKREGDFTETLFYVIKKGKTGTIPRTVTLKYRRAGTELTRVFDPAAPSKKGLTVLDTCLTCHQDTLSGEIRHGPVDAGLCTICHNPHGSGNPAWLRKPSWNLCVTCHAEKAGGRHVVSGFVSGNTHPTRDRRDPSRPGKTMSCTSCHSPHSAATRDLFVLGIKMRFEMCGICHRRM